jgi:hypothetical protein
MRGTNLIEKSYICGKREYFYITYILKDLVNKHKLLKNEIPQAIYSIFILFIYNQGPYIRMAILFYVHMLLPITTKGPQVVPICYTLFLPTRQHLLYNPLIQKKEEKKKISALSG